jgi:hypothetical protein
MDPWERYNTRLYKDLDMDDRQVRRVEDVLLEFRERHKAETPPNQEEADQMMDPRMRAILSPDQYTRWRQRYIDGQRIPTNRDPEKPPSVPH